MSPDRAAYVASLTYLSADEAAVLLRISTKQVYRLTRAGRLTPKLIGRKQIYRREDLDRFMRDGNDAHITPMDGRTKVQLAQTN